MTVALVVVWLHLLGVVVWIGGVMYQAHVLMPAARAGAIAPFADTARRARPLTWTAVSVVVLTGFYNITQLGPLEKVMDSGAGMLLVAKFALVIVAVAVAAQRDFARLPILHAAIQGGGDHAAELKALARMDRTVLLLAVIVMYLGLAVSRSGARLVGT
ncbi:MAG TPA: CopD family protein [Candidatus Limnocylindria bacterium]|nr:CopD family protein [Candidatus Limnocylindria bacterium]